MGNEGLSRTGEVLQSGAPDVELETDGVLVVRPCSPQVRGGKTLNEDSRCGYRQTKSGLAAAQRAPRENSSTGEAGGRRDKVWRPF